MKGKTEFKKPEILAPAGTYEALEAAVSAGADAVYLGGDLFSARAYAGNFSKDVLLKAIDYCHLFGVRLYMTVNTLFKEDEAEQLADYLMPYYRAGVDAVLVQDPGAARILKVAFPDLPLHASTQMSISSEYGARFLKQLGFTRIVPARELTLEELRRICDTVDIEVETFVHGAMCFAYSGKCLFSSWIGGRSGNRGRCAQPCRQCYDLGGQRMDRKIHKHILSLKDMCTLSLLPELMDAGIDSFKIEGRMKNPEYVAGVTAAYRIARDYILEGKLPEDISLVFEGIKNVDSYSRLADALQTGLMDLYNRGGFCTGYYKMEKGRSMFAYDRPNHAGVRVGSVKDTAGPVVRMELCENVHEQDVLEIRDAGVELTSNLSGKKGSVLSLKGKELRKIKSGMKVYRTRNNQLLSKIDREIIAKERKVEAKAIVCARKGKPLAISMQAGESSVEVYGDCVEQASRQPVTREQVLEKMQKTNGTNLTLQTETDIEEDVFFSMGALNHLRREAMDALKQELASVSRRGGEES